MLHGIRPVLISVLILILCLPVYAQQGTVYDPPLTGTITGSDVRLRSSPSLEASVVGTTQKAGTQVEVLEKKDNWYKIRVFLREVWISADYLKVQEPAPTAAKAAIIAETAPKTVSQPPVSGAAGSFSDKVIESTAPVQAPEITVQKPAAEPTPEPPMQPAPKAERGEGVLIREIIFEGNTVVESAELEAAAAEFKGRRLTLEDMSALTDKVTLIYQEKGYILARAYLPEQDIEDGVLNVAVAEGRVGKLEVTGDSPYSERVIKRYFQQQKDLGVINESSLEKGLVMSNEIPNLKTGVVLKEGEETGEVDVVIDAKDTSRMTANVEFKIDYNNLGAPLVSADRFGAEFKLTDHQWGSVLKLRGVTGDVPKESTLVLGDYQLPVNSYGTKIGAGLLWSNYLIGQSLADLGIGGTTRIFNLQASHPLIKKRNMNFETVGGYQKRILRAEIQEAPSNVDQSDVLWINFNFDNLDRFLGKNIISAGYRGGHLTEDDQLPFTRQNVDLSFSRGNLNVARVQKVYGYTSFLLRGSGQLTEERLIPSEMIFLGGYGSVRGYEPATILGDYGYTFTGELLFPPPTFADKPLFGQRVAQIIQLAMFYDGGTVWVNDPLPDEFRSEHLYGYGVGIRLFYKDRFSFKWDIGFPGRLLDGKPNQIHYVLCTLSLF
jgi:hemolysin activation/secretion protein